MPSDHVAAQRLEGASESQTQPEVSSAAEDQIPVTTATDIARHAGVPEEVIQAINAQQQQVAEPPQKQEEPETSAETKEETQEERAEEGENEPGTTADEGAAEETEAEETEEGEEPEAEEKPGEKPEEEPAEGKRPNWYQKRLAKWQRQKDRLQDEIDDLREQVTGKQHRAPAQPAQRAQGPDPLASVETFEQLQQVVDAQRQVRDWCMENPDGVVVNEGQANERVVTPEEVRKTLIGATRLIEAAPRKANELQTRAHWSAISHAEWPELFDRESEIHQTAQQFLQQYPAIAQNPARDFILGLMTEGWKTFQPRLEAKMKGQQQPNGAKPNGSVPEALKRKIPPIPKTAAPNPPRGSRVRTPVQDAAAAVQRIVTEGATPESIQAAIAAIEKQNAVSGGTRRTAAPV